MMKICELNFLFVTFFMSKCARMNPGFIIIHMDESEETTEGMPKIDKVSEIQNRQIVGIKG